MIQELEAGPLLCPFLCPLSIKGGEMRSSGWLSVHHGNRTNNHAKHLKQIRISQLVTLSSNGVREAKKPDFPSC